MSNKLTVDFEVKNSDWIHNFDNEIQVAVMEGNTDDIIERINLFDNVDADSLEFDETNKMFKRPNRMICIQGRRYSYQTFTTPHISNIGIDNFRTQQSIVSTLQITIQRSRSIFAKTLPAHIGSVFMNNEQYFSS